jgi:hypothetical protein
MERENLKDWYVNYIKNRDIIFRKIQGIEYEGKDNLVIVTFKDNSQETALIADNIESFSKLIENFEQDNKIMIVTLNRRSTINILIKEWTFLKEFKQLSIMFVNQDSMNEKRWIIKPHIHDRITESASLRLGIESIAMNVDIIE